MSNKSDKKSPKQSMSKENKESKSKESLKPRESLKEPKELKSALKDSDTGSIKGSRKSYVSVSPSVSRKLQTEPQKRLKLAYRVEKDDSGTCGECCGGFIQFLSILLIIFTLPFSLICIFKVVQEYERAIIFRLGRLMKGGARGPGVFLIIPCIDEYYKVDLRTITYDVPPQEILSRDSVTVQVDAVVYYRVNHPTLAVANVEDCSRSTQLLAATMLRNVLGTLDLQDILTDREHINFVMRKLLDDATDPWGVRVERVEIKDVKLPPSIQRAMAAEAEALRQAKANLIAAEGERTASYALRQAAEVLSSNPAGVQLRYLQTLNNVAAEQNSTVLFPLPLEFLPTFQPGKKSSSKPPPEEPKASFDSNKSFDSAESQ